MTTKKSAEPFALDIVTELRISVCALPEASSLRDLLLRAADAIAHDRLTPPQRVALKKLATERLRTSAMRERLQRALHWRGLVVFLREDGIPAPLEIAAWCRITERGRAVLQQEA